MRTIHAFAAALILLAAPAGVLAEGKGRSGPPPGQAKGATGHDDADAALERVAHAVFTEVERRLIHEFFGVTYHGGGGGGLPPGLRKQLDARGALPPGLANKPLPPGLARKLSPAPDGYRRVIVGSDVLLIQIATGIVVDAVIDVVTGR